MSPAAQGSPPRKRRSELVVPQRPKWQGEIAAAAIWILGSALFRTWRLKIRYEVDVPENATGPFIAALWHNRLAVAMPAWQWWRSRHSNSGLAALISASRDGALLARAFSYFGVKPIRGSSSRRGSQALLELTSALQGNINVAITPDGPRGPRYRVQPGVIALAGVSGIPIIPVGVRIFRKKQLRSWDAFQLPLPFSRCEVVFGKLIHVPRDATPEQREEARLALEQALLFLNPD